jgi:DNA-binding transcriptional ArsR family regulator
MSAGAPTPTPERIAAVLAAVGEPKRLVLIRLLLDGERSVRDCAESTGLAPGSVRNHLGILVDAGVVRSRHLGGRDYHSLTDPEGVQRLLGFTERLTLGATAADGARPTTATGPVSAR